jgi:uncharacterized repeat protein (TIGR03843 family)
MGVTANPFTAEQILGQIEAVSRFAPPDAAIHQELGTIRGLLSGAIELEGLMPWSSNYTFLVKIEDTTTPLLGIYKPGAGERPLWDFPDKTLSLREFASFLVSVVLGWPRIPPTVLRNGPHGLGSVQLFVEAEYEAHYFNMRDIPAFADEFRKMALFDYIVNNADRKGGHCLKGKDGQVWAIDHGLTFHTDPKLRTVIWEYCSEPIPEIEMQAVSRLESLLGETSFPRILGDLIAPTEIDAFKRRVDRLVKTGSFPDLRAGRNVPYPPI